MPPEVTLNCLFLPHYGSNLYIRTQNHYSTTNVGSLFQFKACLHTCEYPLFVNVLYTALEIGSGRPKNGAFLDIVCQNVDAKMSARA